MKIVVDENVSYGVVIKLLERGYNVISIAKEKKSTLDKDIFRLVLKGVMGSGWKIEITTIAIFIT